MDKKQIMTLRQEIAEHIRGASDRRTDKIFIPFLTVAAKQVIAQGEKHALDVFVVACALGAYAQQAAPGKIAEHTEAAMFHFADALAKLLDPRPPAQEDLIVFSANRQAESFSVPAHFRKMYFRYQAMGKQIDEVTAQLVQALR